MPRFFNRLLDLITRVRPEERGAAGAAFVTLFGFMAGHAVLETARDALFLSTLPASQLPWVYLTMAAVALLLAQRQPPWLGRLASRSELGGWLVLSGVVTIGFWVLMGWASGWIYYALYTWSGVLATLVVVRFWTVLGSLFTVTQAKRVFALIASGSVTGAIVGSALARVLSELMAPQHLVLSAALVFLTTSLAPITLGRAYLDTPPAGRTRSPLADLAVVGRIIWARPYLRRVAVLILLSTITFTLVDFVFKSTVARLVAPDELPEFFSSVYLVLNMTSLAVQVLAVGWLLRRGGVSNAVAIVPALLCIAATGFVIGGGLVLVLLLRGIDGSLRHSLHRTSAELLFVPLSSDLRASVKGLIDVIGQRGGQALGSIVILVGLTVTSREAFFAGIAAIIAGVWLYFARELRGHYLNVFRETLSDEASQTTLEFPALDMASLETLLTTLSDRDDRKVIAALELLAAQGKIHVVPALILFHPSRGVVERALDLFVDAGRGDILPVVERLVQHPEPSVRAGAIRAIAGLGPDEPTLRRASGDSAEEVRATASVGLMAGGWSPETDRDKTLHPFLEGSREARIALARAIRINASPLFADTLIALVRAPDAEVQLEAVRAMRAMRSPSLTSTLMVLLPVRSLREEVNGTLVALGPAALARLGTALRDRDLPHEVRRHLPRAIGAFGSPQAATLLCQHLLVEWDGMIRFKILRALGRWRREQPGIPLDHRTLRTAVDQTMTRGFGFMRWRRRLEHGAAAEPGRRTPTYEVLNALIRDKQNHALDRIFRLLNLQANNDDFLRIYRGLHSPRRESRAGSRELLEHLVFPPVREPLVQLIDDLYESSGATPSERIDLSPPDEYERVLSELLESGIESVSSLAAYHAAELGLQGLRDAIGRTSALSSDHHQVLVSSRGLLAEGAR